MAKKEIPEKDKPIQQRWQDYGMAYLKFLINFIIWVLIGGMALWALQNKTSENSMPFNLTKLPYENSGKTAASSQINSFSDVPLFSYKPPVGFPYNFKDTEETTWLQGFGNWFNSRFMALFLSSTVFGLLHFSNPEIDALGNKFIVQYITAGFILGIIALMDDGLELSLGLHAAQNLIGVLLLTADWTVLQTESILKYTADPEIRTVDLLVSLSLYLIVLIVFARKYSWNNWKEKLFSKIR